MLVQATPVLCDEQPRRLGIRVCTTLAELAALRAAWGQLVAATGYANVFLTHEWCATWCQCFARDGTLRIVCLHDGERLVAIAPFVLTRSFGVRTLRWVGSADADYLGILCAPRDLPAVVTAVLAWLEQERTTWDVVHWRDIDETLLNLLTEHCPPRWRLISRMSEVCPYILIDGTWEDYMARRKERFRRLRQTINKTRRSAQVTFRYAEDDGLTAEQVERDIAAIEADSWKAAQGRTLFRPDQRVFWRTLLPRMLPTRELTVCLLDLDGIPAAYSLGFRFGNKIYGRSTAFREQFRALSPGSVLMEKIIRDAFAAGCREFDFTRGDEGYKDLWTSHVRHSHELVMYSTALRTRVAVEVLYRRRWALRGNPYARRAKLAFRVVRERVRRALARKRCVAG